MERLSGICKPVLAIVVLNIVTCTLAFSQNSENVIANDIVSSELSQKLDSTFEGANSSNQSHHKYWQKILADFADGLLVSHDAEFLESPKEINSFRAVELPASAADQLQESLARLVQQLSVLVSVDSGIIDLANIDKSEFETIRGEYNSFKAQHLLLLAHYDNVNEVLSSSNQDSKFVAKLAAAKENYIQLVDPLGDVLETIFSFLDEEKQRAENEGGVFSSLASFWGDVETTYQLNSLQDLLEEYQSRHESFAQNIILGNSTLPYRNSDAPSQELIIGSPFTPSYLQNNIVVADAADLQPGDETLFSDDIRKQAESLSYDPIKIYQFVRNEVDTQLYAGAMKGAENTLIQKAGNDVDQASLLIALLRASGIPSRYVHGIVELPIEFLQQQLAINDPQLIVSALRKAGLPVSTQIRGGRIAAIQTRYTWVSAQVPYANYRGAVVDTTGKLWLPLMPAAKKYDLSSGANIFSQMALDADLVRQQFFDSVQETDVVSEVKALVSDYLQQNNIDLELADLAMTRTIQVDAGDYLPNSLPLEVIAIEAEATKLTESFQHRVQIISYSKNTENSQKVLDVILPLSQFVSRRVTLSYLAGSVDEQNLINRFGGLGSTPAYLVGLRPQIKIDGQLVAAGSEAIPMADSHQLTVKLIAPFGEETISRQVIAGGYHAIAITAQGLARAPAIDESQRDTEFLGARLLSQIALRYNQGWFEAEDFFAGFANQSLIRPFPSVTFASNDVAVTQLLGQPQELEWRGVNLDAKLRIAEAVQQSADAYAAKDWRKLSGIQGSYLEHTVFQELFGVESISADKGFALANEQQIPIHTFSQSSATTILPQLSQPQHVIDALQLALDQGYDITIPESEIVVDAWQGSTWLVEDTTTGEAGYFISRGLAGGTTAANVGSWPSGPSNALQQPYLNEPNENPFGGAEIQVLSDSNYQIGTVGEMSDPLKVRVVDSDGRPVSGATVVFSIGSGAGQLTAPAVVSDSAGIAETTFIYPESTASNSAFFQVDASHKYAAKVGNTLVDASVQGETLIISGQPFHFVAKPGGPSVILGGTVQSGFLAANKTNSPMQTTIADQFGNPVANVRVNYSIGAAFKKVGDTETSAPNMSGVWVADNKSCNRLPLPPYGGSCNPGSASGITHTLGRLWGYPVFPDDLTDYSTFEFNISAGGAGTAKHFYTHNGSNGHGFISWSGNRFPVPAAKVGESYSGRIIFEEEKTANREVKGFENQVNYPSDGGAIPIGGSKSGNNTTFSNIPLKGSAGLNRVVARIKYEDKEEEEDYDGPRLATVDLIVEPITEPLRLKLGASTGEFVSQNHLSIKVSHKSVEDGGSGALGFLYKPNTATVLVKGGGKEIYLDASRSGSSGGRVVYTATLPRSSFSFGEFSSYEIQAVFDKNTVSEITSDFVALPVDIPVIAKVFGSPSSSIEIDTVNDFTCVQENDFGIALVREAQVKIELTYPSGITVDYFDGVLSGGVAHQIDAPAFGEPAGVYDYKIIATGTSDGKSEIREGEMEITFVYRNSLPIGHANYENIDLFDGHLAFSNTDFEIKGRGQNLSFTRSYSSNNTEGSPMGPGWAHNYDSYVVNSGCGTVTVVGGDGGGVRFFRDATMESGFRPAKGYHSKLKQVADGFDFYSKDGTHYHYHGYSFPNAKPARWYLEYVEDINSNLTKFAYNPSSRVALLEAVEDSAGRKIEFFYDYRPTFYNDPSEFPSRIASRYPASLSKVRLVDGVSNLLSKSFEVDFTYDIHRRLTDVSGPIRTEKYTYLFNEPDAVLNYPGFPPLPYFTLDAFLQRAALQRVERPEGDLTYSWDVRNVYTPGVIISSGPNGVRQGFVIGHSNRWGGPDVGIDYSNRTVRRDGLLATVTDARGVPTQYEMNRYGHPTEQVGPAGTMTFTWTGNDSLMLSKTDENNVLTEYSYDQHGNRLSETVSNPTVSGSPVFNQSWTYTRREENVVLMETATDRNGNITTYDYNDVGNLARIRYPIAAIANKAGVLSNIVTEEKFTYHDNGDRLSVTDPRGNLTRFSYDDFGNVTQITDALGNITRREWNSLSLQTSEIDPRGFETKFDINLLGLPEEEVSPVGTTYRTWNAVGKKLSETDPDGRTTTWTYSTNNQLERVDRPDGINSRSITYDLAGNMDSETDFRGFATNYIYNDANYQEQVLYPQALVYDVASDTSLGQRRQIARQFDGVGNVIHEQDAGGRITRFDYDPLYRTTNIYQLFDDGSEFLSENIYDGENLLTTVDAENRATRFEYDALNRRIKQISCLLPNANPITCVNLLQTMEWRFDATGNLVSEVDYKGSSDLNEYDAINRLIAETNRVGDTTSRVYDKTSNVIESYDGRLNRTLYRYDAVNRLVEETDARNFSSDYSYYPSGLLDTESFANGNTVVHTYDPNGLLETSTDLIGLIRRKIYDADDNVIQEIDGEGYEMDYVFNERGEKIEEHLWQKPGASTPRRIVRTDYDLFGNVARVRDPKLNASTWSYDLINRVVGETNAENNSVLSTYDRVGNKLTQTDRRGNTTTWEYDGLYRMARVIDPAITNVSGLQEITFDTYDNNSNLLATTDKRGFVTETTYDAENRPLITSRNSIAILENSYDATGNVVLTRDANGNVSSFSFDARNQLSVESRPHAAVSQYEYDAMGNRIQLRDPENRDTTWLYDLRNRMESQSNPELETTVFTYSLNDQQLSKQLPNGVNYIWAYAYDDDNRLATITSPLDDSGQAAITTYAYDVNSNVVTQTDAEQNATVMEYDLLNRKTLMRYPDLSVVTYDSYDENSNLTAMTDAKGNSSATVYDEINRATLQNYIVNTPSTATELASVSMSYDANNNPVSTIESYIGNASPAQTTTKTYDNFDRELSRTDSFGLTARYGYDLNGNRDRLTDPNGIITRYFFDELNRTTHVVNNQGTTEYQYNRASELSNIRYPNNTTADYVYYIDSRIHTINNQQNGVTVSSYEYTFDANGNRDTQIEINGGAAETTTYGYDNLDRLQQVVYPDNTTSYTYDLAYNRTSEIVLDVVSGTQTKNQSYNYNNRKQLTDIVDNIDIASSIVYSYDANGNQTQKTKGAEVTDFVYDVRNNMRTVTIGGSTVGQFLYDSAGLRIEKIGERGVERSTYDGLSVLIQSDENNQVIAKYDYGPNRLLSLNHQSEGLQFYLTDALNSVVNLTNNSGAVQARYQYDAWGNKRNEVGSSWNRFGFTGHEHDEETGLIYAKARFYDPDTGRFLGEDAWEGDVMLPPSLHKYLYAYQNPTVWVDPDGNAPVVNEVIRWIATNPEGAKGFAKGAAGELVDTVRGTIEFGKELAKRSGERTRSPVSNRLMTLEPVPLPEREQMMREDIELAKSVVESTIDGLAAPVTAYREFKEGNYEESGKYLMRGGITWGGLVSPAKGIAGRIPKGGKPRVGVKPEASKPKVNGESDSKPTADIEPVEIELRYKTNPEHNAAELKRQAVEDQAGGLQQQTAGEIKSGIEQYNANGRPPLAEKTTRKLRKENPVEAEGKAATHGPDCCLSNPGDKVTGFGGKRENSSIGSQNKTNQPKVYDAVKDAPPDAPVKVKVIIDGEVVN